MTEPGGIASELQIPQQPQRQDSLRDQLRDLHMVATRLGMYDAADFIWKSAHLTQLPGQPYQGFVRERGFEQ